MKNLRKALFLMSSVGLALMITSCESDEQNLSAKVQSCFNEASSASEAQVCTNLLSGYTGDDALYWQCIGLYMSNGMFDSQFVTAFESLSDTSGSVDSNLKFMYNMLGSFDNSTSTTLQSTCVSSGNSLLIFMSSYTRMAAYLNNIGAVSSATDVQTRLNGLNGNTTALTEFGAIAKNVYDEYCGGTGTSSGSTVCSPIQQAIDSNPSLDTSLAIGVGLQQLWAP